MGGLVAGAVRGTEGVLVRRGLKQPACIAVVIASKLIGSLALVGRSDVVGALQAVF